jgi:hypothetical protein
MSESPFGSILAKTGQNEKVTGKIQASLDGLFNLITRHNSRVMRIQQTRAVNPNDPELLDTIRRNQPELADENAEFEAIAEEYEAKLAALREKAKEFVKPPLSEEEVERERKAANEEAKLIEDEMARAEAFADMADTMLEMMDAKVDGGILSLIPPIESLKGRRKASTSSGSGAGAYRTRIEKVTVDGEEAFRLRTIRGEEVRESNLIHAANLLNAKWNSERLPQNAVTDEALERAMYASKGVEFRDSTSLPPVVEFDFTKEIAVQQPNDDSVKVEPQTVHLVVTRKLREDQMKKTDEKTDDKSDDKSDDNSAKADDNSATAPEVTDEKKSDAAPVNAKAAAVAQKKAASSK